MIKRPFVTQEEFREHLGKNWHAVHNIWEKIKRYINQGGTHTHPGSEITSIVDDADKIDGREIYVSDDAPSGGADGDIWLEF